MRRKTSKDYRKEYIDLLQKQKALEARIRNRAIEMCKAQPTAPIGRGAVGREIEKPQFQNASTEAYLDIITMIEEHNERHAKIKQGKLFN